MSLNSTSIKVSNSTAKKVSPAPARPREPLGSPRVLSSEEMRKASPPPMEEGLRLVTEKEKKVVKLAGEELPDCRKVSVSDELEGG
ncbi:hypothetical protein Lalb_Chr15g0085141 [Lupinus albus]|uniref:Uncharacterized protein n=1 Tax=Lupinus albus TaxID=3870 RepID=A0A6A4PDV7_LUPAL|nr:hypothetical protein Lalb_Chr15g0085141 [Lupinus albus]